MVVRIGNYHRNNFPTFFAPFSESFLQTPTPVIVLDLLGDVFEKSHPRIHSHISLKKSFQECVMSLKSEPGTKRNTNAYSAPMIKTTYGTIKAQIAKRNGKPINLLIIFS